MSDKSKKSDKKNVPAKKGVVVNRRHNRTVNQDVAASNGKWVDIGKGILKLKGAPHETAYKTLRGKSFVNLTKKEVDFMLAPKDAPEEQQEETDKAA